MATVEQAIGLLREIFGLPALVAAVVPVVILLLSRRWLLAIANDRVVLPSALAIAFVAGYLTVIVQIGRAVLPRSWAEIRPQQAWEWLPYLGLAAGFVAAAVPTSTRLWRALGITGLALLTGCLLTPDWSVFGLTRPFSIGVLTAYLLLLVLALHLLPDPLIGQTLIGLMALSAALLAIAVGAQVSVRFAQLAANASTSLVGCWVVGFLEPKPSAISIRRMVQVFVVLVGGIAFTACVEPDPPQPWLLAIPLLPLALWTASAAQLPFAPGKKG